MSMLRIRQGVVAFLVRHCVEALTVAVVLFVLQTGLVPFDFSADPAKTGNDSLFETSVGRLTVADIVSNIFLYVPLGAMLNWSFQRRFSGRERLAPLVLSLGTAAALSFGIEWLQSFSPARVSSLIDLVSNVLGAILGVCLTSVSRLILPPIVSAAVMEFRIRPEAALLKTYTLLLVVFAAMPFSFSLEMGSLKRSVGETVFVPFTDSAAYTVPETLDGVEAIDMDVRSAQLLAWRRLKRVSRWTAECVSFAVFAWLLQILLRDDYRFSLRAARSLVCWLGGLLAVGMSLLQLPIVSRVCDVTDILFRLLGLCVGLVVRATYLREVRELAPGLLRLRWRRYAKLGCFATAGYIFYTGVIPLTFAANDRSFSSAVSSEAFLPFFAYFVARFDIMMDDAMEKFATYAVFSALMATCLTGAVGARARVRFSPILAAGLTLACTIELIQIYVPVRVPSLTDLILAGVGCVAGVVVHAHVAGLSVATHVPVGTDSADAPGDGVSEPGLSPLDALVAGLADPHPDAPKEHVPRPAPKPADY